MRQVEKIKTKKKQEKTFKKSNKAEISKFAESVKNNVDNGGKMWEVKMKLKKK